MINESPKVLALVTLVLMGLVAVFGLMGMAFAPSLGQQFWLFFIILVEGAGFVVLAIAGILAIRERLGV